MRWSRCLSSPVPSSFHPRCQTSRSARTTIATCSFNNRRSVVCDAVTVLDFISSIVCDVLDTSPVARFVYVLLKLCMIYSTGSWKIKKYVDPSHARLNNCWFIHIVHCGWFSKNQRISSSVQISIQSNIRPHTTGIHGRGA